MLRKRRAEILWWFLEHAVQCSTVQPERGVYISAHVQAHVQVQAQVQVRIVKQSPALGRTISSYFDSHSPAV